MIEKIALLLAIQSRFPGEGYYLVITWSNGTVSYLPAEILIVGLVLLAIALLIGIVVDAFEASPVNASSTYELSMPETAEHYEEQATQIRAIARKLDAETELAERYINAKRTRALLEELPEIIEHDKATRRR
jgi:hypothetical protein